MKLIPVKAEDLKHGDEFVQVFAAPESPQVLTFTGIEVDDEEDPFSERYVEGEWGGGAHDYFDIHPDRHFFKVVR